MGDRELQVIPGAPNRKTGRRFGARDDRELPRRLRQLWGKKRLGRTKTVQALVRQALEVIENILLDHPDSERGWQKVSMPIWQLARISAALRASEALLPAARSRERGEILSAWAHKMLDSRVAAAVEQRRHNQLVHLMELFIETRSPYTLDELRAEMMLHDWGGPPRKVETTTVVVPDLEDGGEAPPPKPVTKAPEEVTWGLRSRRKCAPGEPG